ALSSLSLHDALPISCLLSRPIRPLALFIISGAVRVGCNIASSRSRTRNSYRSLVFEPHGLENVLIRPKTSSALAHVVDQTLVHVRLQQQEVLALPRFSGQFV